MNSKSNPSTQLSDGERKMLSRGAFDNLRKIGTRTDDKERVAKSRLKKKLEEENVHQFQASLNDWTFINSCLSRSNPEMRDEIKTKMAPHVRELAQFVKTWLPKAALDDFITELITTLPVREMGQSYINPKTAISAFNNYLKKLSFSGDSYINWDRDTLDGEKESLITNIQGLLDKIGDSDCVSLDYFNYNPARMVELQRCILVPGQLMRARELITSSRELVWKYDGEDHIIDYIPDYDQEIVLRPHYKMNFPLAILASFFTVSEKDEFVGKPLCEDPIEFREDGMFVDLVQKKRIIWNDILDSIVGQMKSRSLVIEKDSKRHYLTRNMVKGQFDHDIVNGTPLIHRGDRHHIVPRFDASNRDRLDIIRSSESRGGYVFKEPVKAIESVSNVRDARKIGRPSKKETKDAPTILDNAIKSMMKENIIEYRDKKYSLTKIGRDLADTDILRISPGLARKLGPYCLGRITIDATLSIWWQKGKKRTNYITIS